MEVKGAKILKHNRHCSSPLLLRQNALFEDVQRDDSLLQGRHFLTALDLRKI